MSAYYSSRGTPGYDRPRHCQPRFQTRLVCKFPICRVVERRGRNDASSVEILIEILIREEKEEKIEGNFSEFFLNTPCCSRTILDSG